MNAKSEIEYIEAPLLRTVGFMSSIALALVAAITLTIGVFTPPISGPLATGTSIEYPYTDILSRFYIVLILLGILSGFLFRNPRNISNKI